MPLQVKVIMPKGVLLETTAETVVLPGVEGDLQILPKHLPLFSPLQMGEMWLDGKGDSKVAVFGGVVEVLNDSITVLADNAELGEKVDRKRADEARERAERRLERGRSAEDVDIARARMALSRALLRLNVSA